MERYPLLKIGLVLLLLVFVGVLGYTFLEGWNFLDALYMVFITISTVGYKEVQDLSPEGRVFTVIFILGGMGIFLYSATVIGRGIFEGELRRFFWKRRLERRIMKMENHIILCGFGRLGRIIARELHSYGLHFLIIDKTPEVIPLFEESNFPYIIGDYTSDATLLNSGIERARAIIITGGSSADNIFVTLTARALNSSIKIIAHCEDDNLASKILKAGADSVFSPYHIGGRKVVQKIIHPNVVDFVDIVSTKGSLELQMEEIAIPENSSIANKVLRDAGVREKFSISIIGIKRSSGEMLYNPASDILIKSGDTLLCLGKKEDLDRFIESISR